MTRDDPSLRFEFAAQVPAFVLPPDRAVPLPMPGAVDRVLVARAVGRPGLRRFEQVPIDCGWPADAASNPIARCLDAAAQAAGVAVDARLERGSAAGAGLWDDAVRVAAAAAVAALTGRDLGVLADWTGLPAASVTAVRSGVTEGAAALLFHDTKASDDDKRVAAMHARQAGAGSVWFLPTHVAVALAEDGATAGRARQAMIDCLAERGTWSRARSGPLADRRLVIHRIGAQPAASGC